jgi:serine phosphatase RsbU (regulator of sigma subunit)
MGGGAVAAGTGAPVRRENRWIGVVVALALGAVVLGLDYLEGSGKTQYIGLLVAVPFLAAALVGPRRTILCGVLAVVAGYLFGFTQDDSTVGLQPTSVQATRLAFIAAATVAAALVSSYRVEREARFRRLTKIAEVAQATVLRPIPPTLGSVRVAVRYASAVVEAHIGGDLYEAVHTPHGVRLIVGDVRGKGLTAVHLASVVLGSFREAAHTAADVPALLTAVDRSVRRFTGDEDFVTALVVQVDDAGRTVVASCAHPPPLLVRAGRVTALEPPWDTLPLGMLDAPPGGRRLDLEPGDRLLLYTDGASEARREGQFFDLEAAAASALPGVPLEQGVDAILARLNEHVNGRLADDVALLVLGLEPVASPATEEATDAARTDAGGPVARAAR